jgi:hypothetical protein
VVSAVRAMLEMNGSVSRHGAVNAVLPALGNPVRYVHSPNPAIIYGDLLRAQDSVAHEPQALPCFLIAKLRYVIRML